MAIQAAIVAACVRVAAFAHAAACVAAATGVLVLAHGFAAKNTGDLHGFAAAGCLVVFAQTRA